MVTRQRIDLSVKPCQLKKTTVTWFQQRIETAVTQSVADKEVENGTTTIITDPFTRADLIQLQREDKSLEQLFLAAEEPESDYMVSDEILYAINKEPSQDENPYKIVVPEKLRQRVLELGHGKSDTKRPVAPW